MKGVEGCLSVPGYLGEVERFESITIQGLNRAGQPVRIKAAGWLARIFQHEIDHLEGTLFIDRAEEVWKGEEKEIEFDRRRLRRHSTRAAQRGPPVRVLIPALFRAAMLQSNRPCSSSTCP